MCRSPGLAGPAGLHRPRFSLPACPVSVSRASFTSAGSHTHTVCNSKMPLPAANAYGTSGARDWPYHDSKGVGSLAPSLKQSRGTSSWRQASSRCRTGASQSGGHAIDDSNPGDPGQGPDCVRGPAAAEPAPEPLLPGISVEARRASGTSNQVFSRAAGPDGTCLRNTTRRTLRRLGLSGNAVTDVSALAGLSALVWLRLPGNPIGDAAPGRLAAGAALAVVGCGDTPDLSLRGAVRPR